MPIDPDSLRDLILHDQDFDLVTEEDIADLGSGGITPGLDPEYPLQVDDCQWAYWSDQAGAFEALDAYTYDNGTAGVGATMTADANAVLTVDGDTPMVGDRVLVDDVANGMTGVFEVTDTGTDDPGGSPWVLTRPSGEDTDATVRRYWFTRIVGGGNQFSTGVFRVVDLGSDLEQGSTIAGALSAKLYAIAEGQNATASGAGAFARGQRAYAGGNQSVAFGQDTNATAIQALAIGIDAQAKAAQALAVGDSAQALNAQSTAVGQGTIADEDGVTFVEGPVNTAIILHSPNDTRYRIVVANDGTLSTVAE